MGHRGTARVLEAIGQGECVVIVGLVAVESLKGPSLAEEVANLSQSCLVGGKKFRVVIGPLVGEGAHAVHLARLNHLVGVVT